MTYRLRHIFARWFWGQYPFSFEEEYLAFRYKFLIVLMVSGALITALFILGTLSQINPIEWAHGRSMIVFTLGSFLLWWLLREHPRRFLGIAWTYEVLCLLEYTSSLVYVSVDELRLMWFFTNVPGVFLLLGKRAGWTITLGTMAGLAFGNASLQVPYSSNAIATALLSLLFLGVCFHAQVDRSYSYFTRMREYNRQLQALASRDPLTELFNARAYYQACDQQIRQSQRHGLSFAVLFVDLDHFKAVNDTHGHAVGDQVLRMVAKILEGSLRRSDLLGRIGGEEFSAFLPATGLDGAQVLAEQLRQTIENQALQLGDTVLRVTASIGVAACSDGAQSMQRIQQRADEAMYLAKQAGRNRVATLDVLN
jgi:diguanylate cyclase (GGDEF)-like protein